MNGYLYILLAFLTISVVYLIFQAAGGRLLGGKAEILSLFIGPKIFQFKLSESSAFRLSLFPLGAYVKFSEAFEHLSPFRKILTVLAGLASYLVLAFVGLGVTEAFFQIAGGFGQLLSGVISPIAVGSRLIDALANVFRENSFAVGLGILAAKMLAFNLIPLGSLSGGMIVIYLLELFNIKSEKFSERFNLIGLLFILIVMFVWIFAFINAFLRNPAAR